MALRIDKQKVNALPNPLGIDTARPEFSWFLLSDESSVLQTAYQVQVSQDADFQKENLSTWDSGKMASDKPFAVSYDGPSLKPKTRYYWRVKVWDNRSQEGPWSSVAWFETGLLSGSEHQARLISRPKGPSPAEEKKPTLYFRRFIDVPKPVIRGRMYATAHGWYKSFVNSTNVTADAQVPRWTPHHIYTEYQTYDVSELFHVGENVLGAIVADGHFRGKNTALSWENCYGDRLGYYSLLELELEGGATLRFTTDESWQVGFGRIIRSDPKSGEKVDLRITEDQWLSKDCPSESHGFKAAEVLNEPMESLVAEETERVGIVKRVKPTRIWESPSGKLLVDFGQNFTGTLRIYLEGSGGSPVVITYSEVLTTAGELNTSYINPAGADDLAQDEIITGDNGGWFENMFSLRGYRYFQIDGLKGLSSLDQSKIEGLVVSTKLEYAGEFSCSDPRLEQFFRNTRWSMMSNFQSTPMDCPTRERAGWLGDIQVFSSAAMYHANVDTYLRRFMRNVAVEQYPDGSLPPWIPTAFSTFSGDSKLMKLFSTSVGWGDVSVLVPWNLYQRYGSTTSLKDQYASMKAWVEMLATLAAKRSWRRWLSGGPQEVEKYVVDTGFHWGEWLRPGDDGMMAWVKNIFIWPSAAVPTAYLAKSSRILSETASLLKYDDDASYYGNLSSKVESAWAKSFISQGGSRIGEDKQDDYVRALQFNLVPKEQRTAAVERLVELVKGADYHLGSGFLSTHMLPATLYDYGHPDVAFKLLQQTTIPSWLYPIERGATSIWETWNGYNDKGEATMSHNHYALGTVSGWFIGGIAGLSNASPGWRHILINPKVNGPLTHASAQTSTPYGLVKSSWKKTSGKVTLDIEISAGTTAEVRLGSKIIKDVGSGSHRFFADV